MKKIIRYEIRWFPSMLHHSIPVGFKNKILPCDSAAKIVKWLRKRGIDAFCAPISIKF